MHYDGEKWRAVVGAAQGAELKTQGKNPNSPYQSKNEIQQQYMAEAVYEVALSIYANHLASIMNKTSQDQHIIPIIPKMAVVSNYLSASMYGVLGRGVGPETNNKMVEARTAAMAAFGGSIPADLLKTALEKIDPGLGGELAKKINQSILVMLNQKGLNLARNFSTGTSDVGLYETIKKNYSSIKPYGEPDENENNKIAQKILRELQGPAPVYLARYIGHSFLSVLPNPVLRAFNTIKGILNIPGALVGTVAIGMQRVHQFVFHDTEPATTALIAGRIATGVLFSIPLVLSSLRTRSNNALHREALKIVLLERLGIANPGGCKSAKDREGLVRLLAQSYQEYIEKNGKTPPAMGSINYYVQKYSSVVGNIARVAIGNKSVESSTTQIDRIFAKNYLASSAQFIAHANAPYASGIKNNDLILGGRQIEVIRAECKKQIKTLINLQKSDNQQLKPERDDIAEKIQRYKNCLPENSHALAEGNNDFKKLDKAMNKKMDEKMDENAFPPRLPSTKSLNEYMQANNPVDETKFIFKPNSIPRLRLEDHASETLNFSKKDTNTMIL
jgi:hypothetical protein